MASPTAHFPDHHGAGVEANAHGELHTFLTLQAWIETGSDGIDNAQAGMESTPSVVFMGHRPAKVNQ
jgi:hypothetical protein